MPTISDYLKYANLQMAAEAFLVDALGNPLTGDRYREALESGNGHASKFTESEAIKFESEWTVVDQRKNTDSGFSGTLFRNKRTNEYVISFRSTEFIDDAIRDSASTNTLEVHDTGWAWGQLSDMESWYQSINGQIDGPLNVTGYSLGGHLATAFNRLHQSELNGGQVITFNGAGVGEINTGTLREAIDYFNSLRGSDEQSEAKRLAALDLEVSDSRNFYAELKQRLADGSWTARDGLDALLERCRTATQSEMVIQETKPLYEALTDIIALQEEAERIKGYTSGATAASPDTPIKVVPAGEIEAQTLNYQLAVYFASQRTKGTNLVSDIARITEKAYGEPRLTNQYDLVGIETTGGTAWSAVANSQLHYGTHDSVFIEDQPITRGGFTVGLVNGLLSAEIRLLQDKYKLNNFADTHSLTLIVDSLNVQNALLNLLPEEQRNTDTARNTVQQILLAASSRKADPVLNGQGQAEGDPLENVLNALGTLVLGPDAWNVLRGDPSGNTWANIQDATHADGDGQWVTFSGRESFYKRLDELLSSATYETLKGHLTLTPLTAAQAAALKGAAPTDFAAFAALATLSPFAVGVKGGSGVDLEATLGGSWGSTYTNWQNDKTLSAEARAAGQATYGDSWYADRSAFLNYWLQSTADNRPIVQDGSLGLNATDQRIYKQLDSGQKIIVQNTVSHGAEPPDSKESQYYLFGGRTLDILQGGKLVDHLYGLGGLDLLDGRMGNDSLEGGAGLDFYRFRTGDGKDVVLDTDKSGLLQRNNELLVLAYKTGDGQWAGGAGTHAFTATREGASLVLTFANSEDDHLTVKNFDFDAARTGAGSYGLRLIDGLPARPDGARRYLGDTEDWDSNPGQNGIQIVYDGQGNSVRADGEGGRARIEQANRDDVFRGSTNPDDSERFAAGAGNDIVYGDGDGANSTTNPVGGNDRIELDAGRDWGLAGGGNDWVEGGAGGDILNGNAGHDVLFADASGDGTLTLEGAINSGEAGEAAPGDADLLSGDAGNDTLIGSAGKDALMGGLGKDVLVGGAGNDDLYGDATLADASLGWSIERRVDEQKESMSYDSVLNQGTWQFDAVTGEADLLIGGAGDDWALGGGGDDLIQGGIGLDVLFGHAGSDIVHGGDDHDVLIGDNGSALADSQCGDDILDGGNGNDVLQGDAGNDVLIGGAGSDTLYGGKGRDVYFYNKGDGTDVIVDLPVDADDPEASVLILGSGIDRADVVFRLGSLHVDVGNGEGVHFEGFDSLHPDDTPVIGEIRFADDSTMSYAEILARGFAIDGTAGDDTLWGSAVTDHMRGSAGDDTLVGYGGDDVLDGGGGSDLMDGGDGNDLYLIDSGDSQVSAGVLVERIKDSSGDDTVRFGPSVDRSTFTVSGRQDQDGNALLVIDSGSGDRLAIVDGAADAIEHYRFADGTQLNASELIGRYASRAIGASGAATTPRLYGGKLDDVLTAYGDTRISGGLGNDSITLQGNHNAMIYRKGDGHDSVTASMNDNVLRVSGGMTASDIKWTAEELTLQIGDNSGDLLSFDRVAGDAQYAPFVRIEFDDGSTLSFSDLLARGVDIAGSTGDDLLIGTAQIKGMAGGAGNDTYRISDASHLVVEAVGEGIDTVESAIDHTLGDNVEDLVLTGNALNGTGNTLDNRLTGNAQNNTLSGGAGDDFLDGSYGNDTLIGGDGNDTYRFSRLSGDDLLVDSGANRIKLDGGIALEDLVAIRQGDDLLLSILGDNGRSRLQGYFANGAAWDLIDASGAQTDTNILLAATPPTGNDLDTLRRNFVNRSRLDIELNLQSAGYTPQVDGSWRRSTVKQDLVTKSREDQHVTTTWHLVGQRGAVVSTSFSTQDYTTWTETEPFVYRTDAAARITQDRLTVSDVVVNLESFNEQGSFQRDVAETRWGAPQYGGELHLSMPAEMSPWPGGIMITQSIYDIVKTSYVGQLTGVLNALPSLGDLPSSVAVLIHSVVQNYRLNEVNLTPGNHRVYGDQYSMVIGNTGNDEITGVGFAYGGEGNDTITDADFAYGGRGDDTYYVSNANDTVVEKPGEGHDRMTVYSDFALPENVEDLMLVGGSIGTGNVLDNIIEANATDNTLDGLAGNDRIDGGAGNDWILGGDGDDTLDGGADASYWVSDNGGSSTIQQSASYVDYNVGGLGVDDGLQLRVMTMIVPDEGHFVLAANADSIDGGSGNDRIDGGSGDDMLIGGAGNDVIYGGDGAHVYVGPDYVDTAGGNDILDGGAGDDVLTGGTGDDTYRFDAGFGHDTLRENDATVGNVDRIVFGAGITPAKVMASRDNLDLLLSAGEIDQIRVEGWFLDNAHRIERIEFADGTTWAAAALRQHLNLAPVVGALIGSQQATEGKAFTLAIPAGALVDGDPDDELVLSASLPDGSALPSWLHFDAASRTFRGTPAFADAGNLDIVLTATDQAGASVRQDFSLTVVATTGVVLMGTDGDDILTGTHRDDTLDGAAGRDRIVGGTGNDGSDVLNGLLGADTLVGGLGNDTYYVDNSGDVVVELAGEGTDRVVSTTSTILGENVEKLKLSGTEAIEGTGNALNNVIVGDTVSNILSGLGGNDRLTGNAGDDTLLGGDGNDRLIGGAGIDFLDGGEGNDALTDASGSGCFNGGAGTDRLTGGASAEIYLGGLGRDTLTTGAGNDVILFNKGDGQDTIAADGTGSDTVSLGGNFAYTDLSLCKFANHLVLKMGTADQLTFRNWYAATPSKPVVNLQVIAEAMAGFDAGGSDPLLDQKVANFDFAGLASAFDAARSATPTLTSWALINALTSFQLAGSDSAAIGGDLAYQYGKNGTLAGMSVTAAQEVIGNANFGSRAQTLQALSTLPSGARLS